MMFYGSCTNFSLPSAKKRQCSKMREKSPAFLTLYGFCLVFIFTWSCKDFSSILHMLIHFTPFPNIITSSFLKIALPKQEQKFLRQIYYSSKLILFSDCLYEIEINVITLGTFSLLSNLTEISQKLWIFPEEDRAMQSHKHWRVVQLFLWNPNPTKKTSNQPSKQNQCYLNK